MEFKVDDILQDLRDNGFICDWIITTHPMVINTALWAPDKNNERTGIKINIMPDSHDEMMDTAYERLLPYMEEVVDRLADTGLHLDFLEMSGPSSYRDYKSLEEPLEIQRQGGYYSSLCNLCIVSFQFEREEKKEPTRFQKVKKFLGFNESIKFNFDDIIQNLKDEYECNYFDVVQGQYDRNGIMGKSNGVCLDIFNTHPKPLVPSEVLPYIEEIMDRLKDMNLHLDIIYVDGDEYSLGSTFDTIEDFTYAVEKVNYRVELYFKEEIKVVPEKTKFQKVKSFLGFNESLILESVKFNKQPKKKGAKTDTYNVVNGDVIIGQVKWSSRMRGYGFLPTKDCEKEVKEFASELMKKWRAERKKNKPKK